MKVNLIKLFIFPLVTFFALDGLSKPLIEKLTYRIDQAIGNANIAKDKINYRHPDLVKHIDNIIYILHPLRIGNLLEETIESSQNVFTTRVLEPAEALKRAETKVIALENAMRELEDATRTKRGYLSSDDLEAFTDLRDSVSELGTAVLDFVKIKPTNINQIPAFIKLIANINQAGGMLLSNLSGREAVRSRLSDLNKEQIVEVNSAINYWNNLLEDMMVKDLNERDIGFKEEKLIKLDLYIRELIPNLYSTNSYKNFKTSIENIIRAMRAYAKTNK